MNAVELLNDLRTRGVELWICQDRLRFRPVSAVTPDLTVQLREHKPELIALLTSKHAPDNDQTAADQHVHAVAVHAVWNAPEVASDALTRHVLATSRAARNKPPDRDADLPPPSHLPNGWTAKSWRERLRHLASACEADHPRRAAELRAWAAGRAYTDTDTNPDSCQRD